MGSGVGAGFVQVDWKNYSSVGSAVVGMFIGLVSGAAAACSLFLPVMGRVKVQSIHFFRGPEFQLVYFFFIKLIIKTINLFGSYSTRLG